MEIETGDIIIGVVNSDIDTANVKIAEIQSYTLRSSTPKIVIEEGEYTSTTSDPVIGGSTITIGNSARSTGTCGYFDESSGRTDRIMVEFNQ